MNPGFRLRFDQLRQNDPTAPLEETSLVQATVHSGISPARNICLVWLDGKRMFFNYAYLTAASFDPNAEPNEIQLDFSTHTVRLQGQRLEALFMALLDQLPRLIVAIDARYVLEEDEGVVTAIQVEKTTSGS